jgi:hypothetical protein
MFWKMAKRKMYVSPVLPKKGSFPMEQSNKEFAKIVLLNLGSWEGSIDKDDCRIRSIIGWLKDSCSRLTVADKKIEQQQNILLLCKTVLQNHIGYHIDHNSPLCKKCIRNTKDAIAKAEALIEEK